MRPSLSGHLAAVPSIYQYSSRIEVTEARPSFAHVVDVRNEHGDSALDWATVRAVSQSVARHSAGTFADVLWCPATHLDPAHMDPGLAAALPSSATVLSPRKPRHRRINMGSYPTTLAALQSQAGANGWANDVALNLPDIDVGTRPHLVRDPGDNLVYGWIAGGLARVMRLNEAMAAADTVTTIDVGLPLGKGSTINVVGRDEVWISTTTPEGRLLLWWWLGGAIIQGWTLAASPAWQTVEGYTGLRWYDNTGLRVIGLAGGSRLISYQAGPGQAVMRVATAFNLSDPYPVIGTDTEIGDQVCRVSDVIRIGATFYAVMERGLANSDGLITAPLVSLLRSTDGRSWRDFACLGRGPLRGSPVLLADWMLVVSPGQLMAARAVEEMGQAVPTLYPDVLTWKLNAGGQSLATTGNTILSGVSGTYPRPGQMLRRYFTVNDVPFLISTELIDAVSPAQAHNVNEVSVESRGLLKRGIAYQPPTDEVFLSGDVRQVDFTEQTVVYKIGAWARIDGGHQNGTLLRYDGPRFGEPENLPGLAILPTPLRPGNFSAAARMQAFTPGQGLFFGWVDPAMYRLGGAGEAAYILREPNSYAPELGLTGYSVTFAAAGLDLTRWDNGTSTLLHHQSVTLADYKPDLAVVVQDGYVQISLSTGPVGAEQSHLVDPNRCHWLGVFSVYRPECMATVPTYVGLIAHSPGNCLFRWLQVSELEHPQTLGRLAQQIATRAGMSLQRVHDRTYLDINGVITAGGAAPWYLSDGWRVQAAAWMDPEPVEGFDVEVEASFNMGSYLDVLFSSTAEVAPWGGNGLSVRLYDNKLELYARSRSGDVVTSTLVDSILFGFSRSDYKARIYFYPDGLKSSRAWLLVSIDERRQWTVCLDQPLFGGYIGLGGTGSFRNLRVLDLPYYAGDHVWSYGRNAVDEIKALVQELNYRLVERHTGEILLCKADYTTGVIGPLPGTTELSTATDIDEPISVIRVVGAEGHAVYADPRLARQGIRLLEIQVPHLYTDRECMSFAQAHADRFYAAQFERQAQGPLDPRCALHSVYQVLDTDGVTRPYLVESYTMTVAGRRVPAVTLSAQMRRY